MAPTKSWRTGQGWPQRLPAAVPARRWRHRFSPRLEALENRVQPGDTLLGVSVVALQAFASISWAPLVVVIPEGSELAMPAGPWLDSAVVNSLAVRPGTKRFPREELGACSISDHTLQNVLLPATEALQAATPQEQARVAAILGAWPDRDEGSSWLPLAAAVGPTAAGSTGERQDGAVASSVSFTPNNEPARRTALSVSFRCRPTLVPATRSKQWPSAMRTEMG